MVKLKVVTLKFRSLKGNLKIQTYLTKLVKVEAFFYRVEPEPIYYKLPLIINGKIIHAIRAYVYKWLGKNIIELIVDLYYIQEL
jgi:hypothetical protein